VATFFPVRRRVISATSGGQLKRTKIPELPTPGEV